MGSGRLLQARNQRKPRRREVFDRHSAAWSDEEIGWFEILLEEQDVDIMAWAIGTAAVPERYRGKMMSRLQQFDYLKHSE